MFFSPYTPFGGGFSPYQSMMGGGFYGRPAGFSPFGGGIATLSPQALMGKMHPNDRAEFDKLSEDEQQKYFASANQSQMGGFSRPPMRGGIGSFLPPPMMGGYGSPMMGGYGSPMMGGFGRPMMGGYGSPMMGGFGGHQGGFGSPMMGGYGSPMMGGGFGSPMMGGFGRPMMGGYGGQQGGFSRPPGQYGGLQDQRLQSTGPYQRHQSV